MIIQTSILVIHRNHATRVIGILERIHVVCKTFRFPPGTLQQQIHHQLTVNQIHRRVGSCRKQRHVVPASLTFLVRVPQRRPVLNFLGTAANTQTMFMAKRIAEQQIKPIRIFRSHFLVSLVKLLLRNLFIQVRLQQSRVTDLQNRTRVNHPILVHLLGKLHHFLGIHPVIQPVTRSLPDREIPAVRYRHLTRICLLRRDNDNPIGSLRTVNSRGRSILQNRDRFNIIGIQP